MIDRELIKTIIAEGFPERQYTSREIRLLDIGKIYTIIGPRRSGKTYLLFQIIDNLLNAGVKKEQILYVNFEDERLTSMVKEDLQTILSAFYELYPENRKRKVYFMFDEIQNAPYWSKFVRRLYDTENCEIYLTGSSAKLLSREIATELRGRTWNYEVFPFSFKEYLKSRGIKFRADMLYSKERYLLKKYFNEYLFKGSFPEVVGRDDFVRCQILRNYFELVVFRDIVERYSIPHPHLVKELLLYLVNNFSRPFSINKYYNFLKSQNKRISKDMLYEIAGYAEDTLYFYFVSIYSNSPKKRAVNPKKIYVVDNGLVNCLSTKATKDIGWLYENLVFMELRRRGYDVYYYKNKYECDFIGVDARGGKHAIQVSASNFNERERDGICEAMDEVGIKDGIVITEDEDKSVKINGKNIKFIPLWKWVLRGS